MKLGLQFHAYYHISIEINSVKEIGIKNYMYCFLDDMINSKNLNPNNTKIDEKINLFTTLVL